MDNGSEIRYFIFWYAKCLLLLLRDIFKRENVANMFDQSL